ncbi:hypothetical protein NLJ89_g2846 [Agrocybe chaxingu]|uniref:Polyketide synthase n=1 Tax=Agrocybe chaxingu TaxID=84603 RepID=A0A9W8K6Q5_9AGAR|nr:hypothetical protein NLJ89_g2846 [Agrocybe chaxingu]
MSPPIAIVGISVELPSGSYSAENLDHKAFFEFLLASGESYEQMPSERFNVEAWKGTGVGKIHVDRGSFLKNIDTFDNVEFGISSKDAQAMAPATRKLLQNTFLALLDSGIDYRTKVVGCFTAGTSLELTNVSEADEFDARGSFAGYPSMVANRISNHLDLLGPSFPIDTACSSTLTALHLAVQAITTGDCEAAVVGGCQLNHRFIDWVTYSQGSLLAKDGKCKPFDSNADGFARAEGCAVVVIKPLEVALRDNDHIYATVLGTAINSTGAAAAPGAPVAESQRDAMFQAFQRAGRSPREVDYVELHATGTAKGDPTEANWVGEHFHREDELIVGSVKGNIGYVPPTSIRRFVRHPEITAFLASLSKVISIFETQTIPPQVNINKLNPGIKWDEYRLRVPLEATPLSCRANGKSLVAIAGSGIGGSNGHVVLEGPSRIEGAPRVKDAEVKRPVLLMTGGLSSRTATSFAQSIQQDFARYLDDLPGLSTVLGRRSKQATWRSYTIGHPGQEKLADASTPQHCPRYPNGLVYVFSGQGPQHVHMGRELFEAFPAFRDSVLEMDEVFIKSTGKSIIHDYGLFGASAATPLPEIWPIALVLPSIAIFQIALFDLLTSLGVKADAIVGHSAGETAMLYTSGAAPKAMAVELAIIRGRSFTPVEELGGTMAAISCSPEEWAELLKEYREEDQEAIVELACFNAPSAVAIAGEETAIDKIVSMAEARKKFARKIRTRVPFHSSMMNAAKEEYTAALKDLFERYPGPHRPTTSVYSTCTGQLFEGSFEAEYYWDNTVSPVRFTEAMAAIRQALPNASFVEIAPHPVLSSYVVSMVSEGSTVLHSARRPKRGAPPTEYVDVLHLLGKLTSAGHNFVDFTALNGRKCSEFKHSLPAYPFSKKKYPLYPDTPGTLKQMEVPRGPLNYTHLRVNKESHPVLAEHIIRGEPIMPAAGFLEMALEFGASTLMNVNMRSILSLSSEKPTKVNVNLDGAHWTVKSVSVSKARKDHAPTTSERLHADGYLSFEIPSVAPPVDIAAIRARCSDHIGSGFYPSLSYFSAYGPRFQRVTNVFFNRNEALASIKGMDSVLASDGKYLLHPAILDACIQVSAYKPFHGDYDPNVYYLPAHVDAIIVHQALKPSYFPAHVYAHVELKSWFPDAIHYDITLVNDDGVRLCSFIGLHVAKHHITPVADPARPLEVAYQLVFHAKRSMDGPAYKGEDRSDLFGSLDKISIRAKMLQRAGGLQTPNLNIAMPPFKSIHQECAPYFETFKAVETIPSSDGPQFDEAIKCTMHSLRAALDELAKSGTRVVKALVVDNVKSELFRKGLEAVVQDFPSLYFELFVDNKHAAQSLPNVPSGIVRSTRIAFSGTESEGLEDHLFDIVTFFNVASQQANPASISKAASAFLVPGGTCIMTERNLDAWDMGYLGTMWYDAYLGAPSKEGTFSLGSYLESLKDQHLDVLRCYSSEDSDPFHFSVECQKPSWSPQALPSSPLFDPIESFAYAYSYGSEMDLQWELSGLNDVQQLDVWITATEGRDGGAAQGLVRALRREYVSWTIRLVIFPSSYDEDMRQEFLERLPTELRSERDIIVSEDRLLVPRLAPVEALQTRYDNRSDTHLRRLADDHIFVRVLSSSDQADVSGIVASVVDANATDIQPNTLVAALVHGPREDYLQLDAASVFPVSDDYLKHLSVTSAAIPGFVTAVLALGQATLSRPTRLSKLRILLTHSDSTVGSCAAALLRQKGAQVDGIPQNASLYTLAKLPVEVYDVIITGYSDRSYLQVIDTLVRPKQGKVFSWSNQAKGLAAILDRDPCAVGDALRFGLQDVEEILPSLAPPLPLRASVANGDLRQDRPSIHALFEAEKAYRGARHIVLTSRSGEKSLESNTNLVVRRMVDYLKAQPELRLSLVALDATDETGMKTFMDDLGPVGGCIILTAVLLDGIFRHLNEERFSRVFHAKIGVLDTLKQSVDVERLDFLVSFTSVSGLIGFGGQTNYGAGNTALEHHTAESSNGFSFICPGILDSTLMLAGTGKSNETRLSALIPWSVSAEDMIRWFDDAMARFQHGRRIVRYVPDLNWEALERTQGMPRLGTHLLADQVVDVSDDVDDSERMTEVIKNVLAVPAADFSSDVPLTAYGIDSLSASRISFLLRPFVEVTQIQLLADITLNDLVRLSQSSVEVAQEQTTSKPAQSRNKADLMTEMLVKYSAGLEFVPLVSSSTSLRPSEDVVLITGTTGTLGANVLEKLLENPSIKLVYALNRISQNSTSLASRQEATFVRQGLDASLLKSGKLVLLEGDLAEDRFGLSAEREDQLLSSVTHIIHNAWRVDFVSSLADNEDLIKGTRKLIDFAQRSRLASKPSLSYVSSIGTYQVAKGSDPEYAPEAPVLDPKVSIQTGYIESKWVAERLFQIAGEKCGLQTNVIRVGLLTGGVNGSWDPSQWFPGIIQSAVYVGCLPEVDDVVSWIPADLAASAIVDMRRTPSDTIHLIHPKPTQWNDLVKPASKVLDVPLVPYLEWFARLEASARDADEHGPATVNQRAALRLTHFYSIALGVSRFHTESGGLLAKVVSDKGYRASPSLRADTVSRLGEHDVKKWMAYWREIGFLPS